MYRISKPRKNVDTTARNYERLIMLDHEYEEMQDIARELTQILIRRGAYNAKTIISEVQYSD